MAKPAMLRIYPDGRVAVLRWSQGSVDEFTVKDFTKEAQREVLRLGPGLYRISIRWRAGYMEVQSVKRVEPREAIKRLMDKIASWGSLFRTDKPGIAGYQRMEDMTRSRQENVRQETRRLLEALYRWYPSHVPPSSNPAKSTLTFNVWYDSSGDVTIKAVKDGKGKYRTLDEAKRAAISEINWNSRNRREASWSKSSIRALRLADFIETDRHFFPVGD